MVDTRDILGLGDRYLSTHVGSFPEKYSVGRVESIFLEILKLGVDVPPIPQLRDFVEMYIHPLADAGAIRERDGAFRMSPGEIGEKDLREIPLHIEEFETISKVVAALGDRPVRAPITGAFTLATKILLDDRVGGLRGTLLARRDLLLEALPPYVDRVVRYAVERGFRLVVIDEPILGTIVGSRSMLFGYKPEDIQEVFRKELEGVNAVCGVHVCGTISPRLVEILAEIDELAFLNHEFHDSPRNLKIEWRRILEDNDKILSPGVLSSKKSSVEEVGDVLRVFREVGSIAGFENLNLLSPDCGFRGLAGTPDAYSISLAKLRVLVQATREANKLYR